MLLLIACIIGAPLTLLAVDYHRRVDEGGRQACVERFRFKASYSSQEFEADEAEALRCLGVQPTADSSACLLIGFSSAATPELQDAFLRGLGIASGGRVLRSADGNFAVTVSASVAVRLPRNGPPDDLILSAYLADSNWSCRN
jgi:hypothetical protein